MWIPLACLFFCSYFALGQARKKYRARKKANDADHGREGIIPEMSLWDMVTELVLPLSLTWSKPSYEVSHAWSQKYGKLLIINLSKIIPWVDTVWINCTDLELSKKVMASPSVWPDRFSTTHYLQEGSLDRPYGILFGAGDHYKRASRLVHRILHQFDFFKPHNIQTPVLSEALELEAELVERIRNGGGRSVIFSPNDLFKPYFLNVISQIVMSHRFPRQNCSAPTVGRAPATVEDVMKLVEEANRGFQFPNMLLEALPWLKHALWLTSFRSGLSSSHALYEIFREIIAQKRRDLNPLSECPLTEPRDLADGILIEIDKNGGEDEYINKDQLLVIIRDLIFGGSDTVSSTLAHALLFLSLNSAVQQRMQAEIDQVIGSSATPQYSDKARMPYTEAVLLEVLRLGSPVPATMRVTNKDTELLGAPIKQGSNVIINYYAIHRSEEIWDDPLKFRPERFLGPASEVINRDKILPFGLGKRSCIAEIVASVSLFILLVTVMRKFSFKISPENPPPSLNCPPGMTRFPERYYVHMSTRE